MSFVQANESFYSNFVYIKKIAFIDIGTNTTRIIVFDLSESPPAVVFEEDKVTRLGRGLAGKVLQEESMQRTLKVVEEYKVRADDAGVGRIIAVCTSAVRDAENRDGFVERLRALGVEPRVLSGEEEAGYVYRGVEMGRGGKGGVMVVVDVGGGSTEIIVGASGEHPRGISVNEGAVRLTERFIASDPPAAEELARMERHVEGEIRAALDRLRPPAGAALIGVAGTAVTLAMVSMATPDFVPEKIHAYNMSCTEVERIYRKFVESTVERRRAMTGMEPGREDVIVAGACLFAVVMRALGAESMEVSTYDLRHGLLLEVMEGR